MAHVDVIDMSNFPAIHNGILAHIFIIYIELKYIKLLQNRLS